MTPKELDACIEAMRNVSVELRDALERADWMLVAYPSGALLAGPRAVMKYFAFRTAPCVVVSTDGALDREEEKPAQ